jgi:hypothetical protein
MNIQPPQTSNNQTAGPDETDSMLPPVSSPVDDFGGSVPVGQTMPLSSSLVPIPDEAADSDLIEKEWVIKAKQIVEHTADDPFRQQEALSHIKADYMKKRYNKDLGEA